MEIFETFVTEQISIDHPSLRGHFPAQPVVPGAVTLSLVEQALSQWLREPVYLCSTPAIKFHRPVPPGQPLEIKFKEAGENQVNFQMVVNGEILVDGRIFYDFRGKGD